MPATVRGAVLEPCLEPGWRASRKNALERFRETLSPAIRRLLARSWLGSDAFVEQAGQLFLGSGERRQPDEPFYHYTDATGFRGILENGIVWATEYQKLNDTTELTLGERAVHDELEALAREHNDGTAVGALTRYVMELREGNRIVDMEGVAIYVTSFSSNGDLLGQWTRYADNCRGYSIGFRSIPLPTGAQSAANLHSALAIDFRPCIYDAAEFRKLVRQAVVSIAERLDWYSKTFPLLEYQVHALVREAYTAAAANVGTLVPFLKHRGFSDEREWRIVQIGTPPPGERFRRRNNEVEYIHVPLRKPELMDLHEVITGPHASPAATELARAILDQCGYKHINVRASEIPLRPPSQ